jgi:hypothetical protein
LEWRSKRDSEVEEAVVAELIGAGARLFLDGYRAGPERGMIAASRTAVRLGPS